MQADVKAGADAAKVEAAISEEMARLIKDGPTDEEVAQAKTVLKSGLLSRAL